MTYHKFFFYFLCYLSHLPYRFVFTSDLLVIHVCMEFLQWNCLHTVWHHFWHLMSILITETYMYFKSPQKIFFATLIFVKQFKQLMARHRSVSAICSHPSYFYYSSISWWKITLSKPSPGPLGHWSWVAALKIMRF